VTWRHTRQAALTATLLAVLIMLYIQVDYYVRHFAG
jgi:hypothetical protein